ncbi:hypothetical protein B0H17DRAFT_356535 [Mycena rosella]|uniref:Uncharacterized protein n=1 Tax=Mycena rosella TaxID=1033263 RepID=A0AAD7DS31_MYCRO|nr:hypothetical protein B0H17DRAFT_356535 [Mycena rosella]
MCRKQRRRPICVRTYVYASRHVGLRVDVHGNSDRDADADGLCPSAGFLQSVRWRPQAEIYAGSRVITARRCYAERRRGFRSRRRRAESRKAFLCFCFLFCSIGLGWFWGSFWEEVDSIYLVSRFIGGYIRWTIWALRNARASSRCEPNRASVVRSRRSFFRRRGELGRSRDAVWDGAGMLERPGVRWMAGVRVFRCVPRSRALRSDAAFPRAVFRVERRRSWGGVRGGSVPAWGVRLERV